MIANRVLYCYFVLKLNFNQCVVIINSILFFVNCCLLRRALSVVCVGPFRLELSTVCLVRESASNAHTYTYTISLSLSPEVNCVMKLRSPWNEYKSILKDKHNVGAGSESVFIMGGFSMEIVQLVRFVMRATLVIFWVLGSKDIVLTHKKTKNCLYKIQLLLSPKAE